MPCFQVQQFTVWCSHSIAQIYHYINDAYQQIAKKARQVGPASRFVSMLGCFMHLAEAGCNRGTIYYIML